MGGNNKITNVYATYYALQNMKKEKNEIK